MNFADGCLGPFLLVKMKQDNLQRIKLVVRMHVHISGFVAFGADNLSLQERLLFPPPVYTHSILSLLHIPSLQFLRTNSMPTTICAFLNPIRPAVRCHNPSSRYTDRRQGSEHEGTNCMPERSGEESATIPHRIPVARAFT